MPLKLWWRYKLLGGRLASLAQDRSSLLQLKEVYGEERLALHSARFGPVCFGRCAFLRGRCVYVHGCRADVSLARFTHACTLFSTFSCFPMARLRAAMSVVSNLRRKSFPEPLLRCISHFY